MNLKREILKLAEMLYTKGFEAGYMAKRDGLYSEEQVRAWRHRSWKCRHSRPEKLNGQPVNNVLPMIIADLRNSNLNEIADYLEEKGTAVEVLDIADGLGGLSLTIKGIENLPDSKIVKQIKTAFL